MDLIDKKMEARKNEEEQKTEEPSQEGVQAPGTAS